LATLTNTKFVSEMPTHGHVTAPDL